MADLQIKDFSTLVEEQATIVQGKSSRSLVDFTIGSILRALVEAYVAVAMWLQGLVLQVLAVTRAATSIGSDLDTWVNDYNVTRLGAKPAKGMVFFARYSSGLQAVVPPGAMVQTADGTQQYTVDLDPTNSAYSSSLGGYVLPVGTLSISLPVTAVTSGAAGNALAGSINTIGTAIAGVDTVTNVADFTTGSDAESDDELRARFVDYISSLSRATKGAVANAIKSVQTGLTYTLVENADYFGAPHVGYFYVVIDDGSGTPSAGLLASISTAIEAVRPLGTSFSVFAPTVLTANVAASITTAPGYDHDAVAAAVRAAISTYVASLPMGASLIWGRLFQIIFDASPGVTAVPVLTINGTPADLVATVQQAIVSGTVSVT